MTRRSLVDLHLKVETVVRELHVRESHPAQPLVRFRVRQIMRDVRKPGAAGLQQLNKGKRLVHRLVHGMRDVTQRVDNQVVKVFEEGAR